jgi:hypothetical protein
MARAGSLCAPDSLHTTFGNAPSSPIATAHGPEVADPEPTGGAPR